MNISIKGTFTFWFWYYSLCWCYSNLKSLTSLPSKIPVRKYVLDKFSKAGAHCWCQATPNNTNNEAEECVMRCAGQVGFGEREIEKNNSQNKWPGRIGHPGLISFLIFSKDIKVKLSLCRVTITVFRALVFLCDRGGMWCLIEMIHCKVCQDKKKTQIKKKKQQPKLKFKTFVNIYMG